MTYPQKPGPYGQDPHGQQPPGPYGPYGQLPGGQAGQLGPGPYGQQPGVPGGGPPKRKTGLILAVVVGAVLVLGVAGYLLIDGDEPMDCASEGSTGCTQEPAPADEPAPEGGGPAAPEEPTDRPAGGGAGVSEGEIREIAQSYVDAVNAQDEQAARQHTCVASDPGALYESIAGTGTVVSIGDVQMNGETFANVELVFGDPANDNRMPLPMTVQDGSWCVEY